MENEVQTRSETNGLRFFSSLEEAMKHANTDTSVWKVSFRFNNESVRLVAHTPDGISGCMSRSSDSRPYKTGKSKIHGIGVFATRPIKAGEKLSPVMHNLWQFAGLNHCCSPNVKLCWGVRSIKALRDIQDGEELTVLYPEGSHVIASGICNCGVCDGKPFASKR